MYTQYIHDIQALLRDPHFETANFKSNPTYNSVLEHVNPELGQAYLDLLQTEFPEITQAMTAGFVALNDRYGVPKRHDFAFYDGQTLRASATSIRYLYHAALILSWTAVPIEAVVEVGCGYGGLYLAICHLHGLGLYPRHKLLHYHLVDLPEVGQLIGRYLALNAAHATVPYTVHAPFGADIPADVPLFFVSNYCLTELEPHLRHQYVATLFPKVRQGFIIWQTVFDCPLSLCRDYFRDYTYCEERPQTAVTVAGKQNYFVQFSA